MSPKDVRDTLVEEILEQLVILFRQIVSLQRPIALNLMKLDLEDLAKISQAIKAMLRHP